MEKTEGLNKNTIAIITSAGWGARMAGDRPKQFLLLDDRPILAVTLWITGRATITERYI